MSSSSSVSARLVQGKMTFLSDKNINGLYKPLILAGFFVFLFYILLSNRHLDQSPPFLAKCSQNEFFYDDHNDTFIDSEPTNISHIVIGISSAVKSWRSRKSYIESWWQPNVTKGYVYLERKPTGFWPTSSPPYRIYEDMSRFKPYDKHPIDSTIRMTRMILEIFNETADQGVRWFVITDDDTILFMENLVEVLSRYDHTKYFYIGANSESVLSNVDNSFEMAFGGAGYALSYPLAEALAKNMDVCIKRYPSLYGSDYMTQSCVADLGVSLTHERGFHQIDLHNDISGFLSSHPHSRVVSLHHLDMVEPIFPSMTRSKALNHLMKAAKADQSRLLQQTICYDKLKNWSFSISWGYSAHVYEKIIPPSVLQIPLETFSPWRKPSKQPYMFNTRWLSRNPCDMPRVFFLESVEEITETNQIVTSYTRRSPRRMRSCSASSNVSALIRDIAKIIVVSPATKFSAMGGTRRECCDILDQVEKNVTMIKYRACMKNEILGVE